MDQGARLWLVKAVRRNYWRVSRWYDLDDVMQEGYYAYYFTVRRYPNITHPPHRMALFKLVFNSVICNLANQRTHRVEDVCESDLPRPSGREDSASLIERVVADPGIEEAAAALAAAPQYVRDAVAIMSSGDERLRKGFARDAGGRRETLNERLCRMVGCDSARVDIVGGIRACLQGEGR